MRTHDELKQLLIQVKDNNYNLPDTVDLDDVITDMLNYIGHTDPELRDALIYSTFGEWGDRGDIPPSQMKRVLDVCLSNTNLFYGIGETGTDSVFTRTFSSLMIPVAVYVHEENPFLTAEELHHVKDTVSSYISLEKDFRGYVDGKGWAHSVAHIADALGSLAYASDSATDVKGDYLGREGLLEILADIKTLVSNKTCVYLAEEDERLANALMKIIECDVLTERDIITWLKSFNMKAEMDWEGATLPSDHYLHVNCKNFARSFFFKLMPNPGYGDVCTFLLTFLVD